MKLLERMDGPAAEKIKEAVGNLLPTPGDTRWNSRYDAVAKVNDLLLTPEQETKFDKLLDEPEIKCLQPVHKTFVIRVCKRHASSLLCT